VIQPQREAGVVVLCDRYLLSTVVYQAVALERQTRRSAWRYLPWILELQRYAPAPDLLVVLDIPAEEAVARLRARELPPDYYERDAIADVVRRAALYREAEHYLPDALADRVVHVDAVGPEDEVYGRVREAVSHIAPHEAIP
jgi:dTMP kinase